MSRGKLSQVKPGKRSRSGAASSNPLKHSSGSWKTRSSSRSSLNPLPEARAGRRPTCSQTAKVIGDSLRTVREHMRPPYAPKSPQKRKVEAFSKNLENGGKQNLRACARTVAENSDSPFFYGLGKFCNFSPINSPRNRRDLNKT